jgi:DNA-binding transcriptional regulator PaaX
MMDASTRASIFGVLVLVNKPVSAPEMVALCKPLGISSSNVKSHLTRLVREGALSRTGARRAHRYAIAPEQRELVQAISSRVSVAPAEPWDGQWLIVSLKPLSSRAERRQLRSRLWFEGFRPSAVDTFLRPAWPLTWAVARAQALTGVSSACVIGTLVGTLHLGQVRRLYRLASIDAQARRLARRIDGIGVRLGDPADGFKHRLTVGGLMVDLVSHVPHLPRLVWGDLTGLQDLQSAYADFEARVVAPANTFVDAILSVRRRREGQVSRMRPRRGVKNRAVVHKRLAR